jgi:GH25 family lysozyme M1 (1,4-beta-N-acetylmuramidase)
VRGLRGRWGGRARAGMALIVAAGLAIFLATRTTAPTAPAAIEGIDVSSLQHPRNAVINWPDVAAAGNTFTAIKVSEATYYVNPYFAPDAVQAARAGLFVMPYAFANPFPAKDNGSAREQADMAAGLLGSAAVPASQLLPLALDIEPDPYAARQHTNRCYGLSQTAMVTWIRQFLAEAQRETGKKPVIYTIADWWQACTGNSAAFGRYPLWIASYGMSNPALPAGWRNYAFWQHASRGAVPGITGTANDQDYFGPVTHVSQAGKAIALAQLQTLTQTRIANLARIGTEFTVGSRE